MTSPTTEGQRAEHSAQPNQLRLDMIAKLREIADRLESGCTNHGCGVRPKGGGMGTNGPCQCWEDAYRSAEWVATQLRQQPRHARRCFP